MTRAQVLSLTKARQKSNLSIPICQQNLHSNFLFCQVPFIKPALSLSRSLALSLSLSLSLSLILIHKIYTPTFPFGQVPFIKPLLSVSLSLSLSLFVYICVTDTHMYIYIYKCARMYTYA